MANEIKHVELDVVNFDNQKVGKVVLPNELFNTEIKELLVQKAVKVTLANRRQATAKTKGISEVSGSGKKPWRQKGTGRARAGSTRSPIWVGGATIFGPTGNQNYKLKQNKLEHAAALASVLTDKANENKIIVLESEQFTSPKTKDFAKALKTLGLEGKKVLLAIDKFDENLFRASKNISSVKVVADVDISVYDVLNSEYLVLTQSVANAFVDIFDYEIGVE